MYNMGLGGVHFLHRPKPYYSSIKYKIIKNNPEIYQLSAVWESALHLYLRNHSCYTWHDLAVTFKIKKDI